MAGEEYDDEFEPDDELDSAIDSFLGVNEKQEDDVKMEMQAHNRSARSRIEDYMERRRLRDEDIDYDIEAE